MCKSQDRGTLSHSFSIWNLFPMSFKTNNIILYYRLRQRTKYSLIGHDLIKKFFLHYLYLLFIYTLTFLTYNYKHKQRLCTDKICLFKTTGLVLENKNIKSYDRGSNEKLFSQYKSELSIPRSRKFTDQ